MHINCSIDKLSDLHLLPKLLSHSTLATIYYKWRQVPPSEANVSDSRPRGIFHIIQHIWIAAKHTHSHPDCLVALSEPVAENMTNSKERSTTAMLIHSHNEMPFSPNSAGSDKTAIPAHQILSKTCQISERSMWLSCRNVKISRSWQQAHFEVTMLNCYLIGLHSICIIRQNSLALCRAV